MDLGEQRDVGARIVRLDGRAHSCAAGTDDEDIVLGLHHWRKLSNGRRLPTSLRRLREAAGTPKRGRPGLIRKRGQAEEAASGASYRRLTWPRPG